MANETREGQGLPVTAEVGGEGGSYADRTHQVATFTGDVRHEGGEGSLAAVPGDDTTTVRHATEAPPRMPARPSRGRPSMFFFGLAAGALMGSVLRRRR